MKLIFFFSIMLIFFTGSLNFADANKIDPENNSLENILAEKPLKITEPSDKSNIFTGDLINLKWEYKSEEKDKSGNVKIEISLDSGKTWKSIPESPVKVTFNTEQTVIVPGYKNSCIVKMRISDKKDSDITDSVTVFIVDPIEVNLPTKEDTIRNGKTYVSWTVNYDDVVSSRDFKVELSTNNGASWNYEISNKSIVKTGRSFSLSFDTLGYINSDLCKIKITDTKNKKESGQSSIFAIENAKSENYGFRLGANFDVFDKKISNFYMSGRISEKKIGHLFGWKWVSTGIDLQLTSSTGHSEDSSFNGRTVYTQGDTIKSTTNNSKSDIYNVYLSSSFTLFFSRLDPIYFILPHLEYRRSINKIDNKRNDVVLRNSMDTIINSESNYKKTNDIWYIGIGLGTDLKNNIFNFSGTATLDYNTSAERLNVSRNDFGRKLDVIFRFNLQEANTEINLGGELIYPLVSSTEITTPVELSFYLSKDISIKKLYDSIFGTSN